MLIGFPFPISFVKRNSLNNILARLSLNRINHTKQKDKGEFITNE